VAKFREVVAKFWDMGIIKSEDRGLFREMGG
jgi:hypothetical protein